LYGIIIWTDVSSVLSQYTRVTVRRTDTLLIASPWWHSMKHKIKTRVMDTAHLDPVQCPFHWQLSEAIFSLHSAS